MGFREVLVWGSLCIAPVRGWLGGHGNSVTGVSGTVVGLRLLGCDL